MGSGYRTPPALVRRSDGQVLQLTPLLYLVLAAADGRRGCAEIAEHVGASMRRARVRGRRTDAGRRAPAAARTASGSPTARSRSCGAPTRCSALKLKVAVTDPRTTHRLTDPFRFLFRPVMAAVVVMAFAAVLVWVFFERGLGASAYEAFERPHLLLLVFVMTVLSGGFHEFGHAAAARYSGAEPGVMGAGLYLVWPAFYTDVTDSYRLGKAGRVRTDLGGLYFNAIVAVLTFGWWWVSGWEALLLLVATQVLQMVQQLLPLLRFDGYHLLADLAGVPDLYQRIRPTLLGLLPHRWHSPENRMLTPWARVVITSWVLVTVPLMALMLWALVAAVPRLLGSAGSAIRRGRRGAGLCLVHRQLRRRRGARAPGAGGRAPHPGVRADPGPHGPALVPGPGRLEPRLGRQARGGSGPQRRAGDRTVLGLVARHRHLSPDRARRARAPHHTGPGGRAVRRGPRPTGDRTARTRGRRCRRAPPPASRLSSGRPLVALLPEGGVAPTKDDPALAMVLVPTADGGPPDPSTGRSRTRTGRASSRPRPTGPRPEGRASPRARRPRPRRARRRRTRHRTTTPGSSPSTSPWRPTRATTRRSRSTRPTTRSPTTSRSR